MAISNLHGPYLPALDRQFAGIYMRFMLGLVSRIRSHSSVSVSPWKFSNSEPFILSNSMFMRPLITSVMDLAAPSVRIGQKKRKVAPSKTASLLGSWVTGILFVSEFIHLTRCAVLHFFPEEGSSVHGRKGLLPFPQFRERHDR